MAPLAKRQKLSILVLVFYWPTLFFVGHIPIPEIVRRANVSDKSLHFLTYMFLTFLLWAAVKPPDTKVAWRTLTAWWVLLVSAIYGVCDEGLQFYVAGRSTDVMDFLADVVGSLTALVLLALTSFWPALLIVTAVAIFSLTNFTRADLSKLLPAANVILHLAGYAFFTAVWIHYSAVALPPRTSRLARFISALAIPLGLVVAVKLGSVLFGKNVQKPDVAIAVAAIAVVLIVHSFIVRLCSRNAPKNRTSPPLPPNVS